MLVARGGLSIGSGRVRSTFVLGRDLHVHAVERSGLVYDSRFLPETPASREHVVVYLAVAGTLEVHRRGALRSETTQGILVRETELEGPRADRRVVLRSFGSPFLGIDLRVARDALASHPAAGGTLLPLDPALLEAGRRLIALGPPATAEAELNVLLDGLVAHGVLVPRPGATLPRRSSRLWNALRPLLEELRVLPSLDELSLESGLSLRQLARELTALSGAAGLGGGWRTFTHRMRLKLAVLALSAEGASIAQVARAVGYSTTDAMGRAFRDAGLPSPTEVREAIGAAPDPS